MTCASTERSLVSSKWSQESKCSWLQEHLPQACLVPGPYDRQIAPAPKTLHFKFFPGTHLGTSGCSLFSLQRSILWLMPLSFLPFSSQTFCPPAVDSQFSNPGAANTSREPTCMCGWEGHTFSGRWGTMEGTKLAV